MQIKKDIISWKIYDWQPLVSLQTKHPKKQKKPFIICSVSDQRSKH